MEKASMKINKKIFFLKTSGVKNPPLKSALIYEMQVLWPF